MTKVVLATDYVYEHSKGGPAESPSGGMSLSLSDRNAAKMIIDDILDALENY